MQFLAFFSWFTLKKKLNLSKKIKADQYLSSLDNMKLLTVYFSSSH